MLVKDILWSARYDYLDDAGNVQTPAEWYSVSHSDCLWSDELLLRHLNTVLNEWCRETGVLRDHTTASICKTLILANQRIYPMSPLITEIHNGYLDNGSPMVLPKDETWLDDNIGSWKRDASVGAILFLLADYDQSFFQTIYYPASSMGYWSGAVNFANLGSTITHTIGSTESNFSNLLKVADQVVVSGSVLNGTTAVPKTLTVTSVSTSSFTVSETLADETAPAGIIQKVTDTLRLSVSRLPLLQLTMADIATQSPEIRSDYHPYLVHGILREAYMKQDSQCLDVNKSKEHKDIFEYRKNQARNERDNLRRSVKNFRPHPGAL